MAVALADGAPGGRDETVAALTPRLEAMVAAAPALGREARARAVAPAVGSGEAVRFVTPAGVRVLVLSDGSAPLVSVQAAWIDRTEGLGSAGDDAAPVIATMLERGTRTRSAADVAAEIQAIGGVLKGFAAPGTLGLRADFLPQHLGRGLALIADCLARPAFAEQELGAADRAQLARARDDARAGDVTARAALRLFGETLWPETVRRDDADAPSTLGRFALLDRYRRRYPLSRLVVAVVGNVDPAAVAALLTNAFPASASPSPPSASTPPASASPLPAVRGEGQGEGRPAAAPATPAPPGARLTCARPPSSAPRAGPNLPPSSAIRRSRRAIRTARRSTCSPSCSPATGAD